MITKEIYKRKNRINVITTYIITDNYKLSFLGKLIEVVQIDEPEDSSKPIKQKSFYYTENALNKYIRNVSYPV